MLEDAARHAPPADPVDAMAPPPADPRDTPWLRRFGLADWPEVQATLQRGFAGVDPRLWAATARRLQAVPPRAADGSLGVLLQWPGRAPQGVCLMLQAPPRPGPGPRHRVNASSWAIEPAARRWAGWMGRHALPPAGDDWLHTALTPIVATQRIIQRLQFRPISHQRLRCWLPRLALLPAAPGLRLLQGEAALRALAGHPLADALHDHLRLGCLVWAVSAPAAGAPARGRPGRGEPAADSAEAPAWQPLVGVPQWRQRLLPAVELVYAPALRPLQAALPALARALLAQGRLLLEFEADEDFEPALPCTRLFRRRFARGPYDPRGIDHLYSELVYLRA